jgi:hypothetical protein
MSIPWWAWLILCSVTAYILIGVCAAVLEAYIDVKNKPREEMFWCTKHGPIRKQHTLPLFPELGGRPLNSHVCPMCYKQAVWGDVKVD